MAIKTFKLWCEDMDAKMASSKDFIVTFLRSNLGIDDDETILETPLASIKDDILAKLTQLGTIRTSSPDIIQRIQNKSGTVRDLANMLAGADENNI